MADKMNVFNPQAEISSVTNSDVKVADVESTVEVNPAEVNSVVEVNSDIETAIDNAQSEGEPVVDTDSAEDKRRALAARYENYIPEPLTHAPFCLFKLQQKHGKTKKLPLTVKNGKIVSLQINHPEDALDFNEAVEALVECTASDGTYADGIGIVFSLQEQYARVVGVDIDKCLVDGELNDLADALVRRFDGAYVERSVSGTGLHIVFFDDFAEKLKRNRNDAIGLEIYADGRFFALTADTLPCSATPECRASDMRFDGETTLIVDEYLITEDDTRYIDMPSRDIEPAVATDELLDIIRKSANADRFNRLFNGDLSTKDNDWSRADFALCVELCFWTNCNFNQIREIWGQSKLAQRDKFADRQGDYDCRTIEHAIKHWLAKGRKPFIPKSARSVATPAVKFEPVINLELPNCWRKDFVPQCPKGFSVDQSGTHAIISRRGRTVEQLISHSVILVDKLIRQVDNGAISVKLICLSENGWITLPPIPREILSSNSKIVSLASFGVDVRTEFASAIATWIAEFINVNNQQIERTLTVEHMGWQHDGSFVYPNSEGKYRLVEALRADSEKFFAFGGKTDIISDIIRDMQHNDIFTFTLGAALAAPLIKVVNAHANIALHIYGKTGCGKSTVAKFAFSLFGNPNANGAIPNADTTKAGIENVFDARRDMPTIVEDIDSVNDDKTLRVIQSLPYQFVNTTGRTRANKDGGNRENAEFRGSLITTGEHPITNDSSKGGGKRRLLEIFVPDNFLGNSSDIPARINRAIKGNFGLFGRDWINVISNINRNQLRTLVNDIQFGSNSFKGLINELPNKVVLHIADVAVIAVALAFFRAHILHDSDIETALSDEYRRALHILHALPDQSEIDDWQRAKQFIIDWIVSHPKNFNPKNDHAYELFGEFNFDQDNNKDMTPAKILSTYLHKLLSDHGFDPKTVIKQLADNGFIQRQDDKHILKQVRFGGGRPLMYIIPGINICPPESVNATATVDAPSPQMLDALDYIVVANELKGKRLGDLSDEQLKLLAKDSDWSNDCNNAWLVLEYRRKFKPAESGNELEHVDEIDIPF